MVAAVASVGARSLRPPRYQLKAELQVAGAIFLIALLIRAPQLGNPILHLDDQFYLLTGQAMLKGELPYVDIWDRKPFGLFLLYAAIGLMGGQGVLQYQLVATLFAAATAFVIVLIARRYSNLTGGFIAGCVYLASLPLLGGGGGQSPVFYNLFMASAALLTLRKMGSDLSRDRVPVSGLAAMTLAGLAMTTKHVAFVEGMFFGLCLLFSHWRCTGSIGAVSKAGFAYVVAALSPSLVIVAGYAWIGSLDVFWFANVTSIFLKHPLGGLDIAGNVLRIVVSLAPLALCAWLGLKKLPWRDRDGAERWFPALWVGAALLGTAVVPNFFNHYALPLMVPLSVAAAPLFALGRLGMLWGALPMVWGLGLGEWPNRDVTEQAKAQYERLDQRIEGLLRGGCLYVYEGPVLLYGTTGACRPSRYIFPDHLNSALERDAIGVRPEEEVARILAARPAVVISAKRLVHPTNRAAEAVLMRELGRWYCRDSVHRISIGRRSQALHVWQRRPASSPRAGPDCSRPFASR